MPINIRMMIGGISWHFDIVLWINKRSETGIAADYHLKKGEKKKVERHEEIRNAYKNLGGACGNRCVEHGGFPVQKVRWIL